ncbi:MAG: GNAT family N-acetyltransferase [Burkholderiaceae bacterium]|nr:GNAT family N-acetyltransferase [Burkholderiaceae bacterium]
MSKKEDAGAAAALEYRKLVPADLERVVAIDASRSGQQRRAYFERRLCTALGAPELHVQFGALRDGVLVGFVMARTAQGEFGRDAPALRMEVIDVQPDARHLGAGLGLLAQLEAWCARRGLEQIRSQAHWKHHSVLEFFDRAGFSFGRNHVIDCEVHDGRLVAAGGPEAPQEQVERTEVDYSGPAANDYEALPRDRVDVRTLTANDAADIARIDRRVTGRERTAYLRQLVDEAMNDSSIRVSLVARVDGIVRGFVMAKTDYGDFGRTEPVAEIDTIGVDPDSARGGVGSALLSQLFVNLQALQVERVETLVARDNLDLLNFLYRCGFGPSERLGFVKQLT